MNKWAIFILSFLISVSSVNAQDFIFTGEDPPLPWHVCEIPMDKLYGQWKALGDGGDFAFYIEIENKTSPDNPNNSYDLIAIRQLDQNLKLISAGAGFLYNEGKLLKAGMKKIAGELTSSIVYIKTYCDEKSGKMVTVIQVEMLDGSYAGLGPVYRLERVEGASSEAKATQPDSRRIHEQAPDIFDCE